MLNKLRNRRLNLVLLISPSPVNKQTANNMNGHKLFTKYHNKFKFANIGEMSVSFSYYIYSCNWVNTMLSRGKFKNRKTFYEIYIFDLNDNIILDNCLYILSNAFLPLQLTSSERSRHTVYPLQTKLVSIHPYPEAHWNSFTAQEPDKTRCSTTYLHSHKI